MEICGDKHVGCLNAIETLPCMMKQNRRAVRSRRRQGETRNVAGVTASRERSDMPLARHIVGAFFVTLRVSGESRVARPHLA
jgi:hypothetical protein